MEIAGQGFETLQALYCVDGGMVYVLVSEASGLMPCGFESRSTHEGFEEVGLEAASL